ncbi:MAG TPA: LysM peptidoglycan-binding domain-containing protein [Chloroflexota bacterium]|jgi:5'-nucleotidase|nr:LysM peptidoglycan-binding domain-containing protein [Chloroflexota bacterium]
MRPARSVRSLFAGPLIACATLSLGLVAGCGGTAAQPTPTTAAPAGAASVAPVPSATRPQLASPSPSPASSSGSPSAVASPAAGEQEYEVQSGDTLLSIAEQFYGDATKWRPIYDANKDTIGADPDKLKLGMKLKIPPKES